MGGQDRPSRGLSLGNCLSHPQCSSNSRHTPTSTHASLLLVAHWPPSTLSRLCTAILGGDEAQRDSPCLYLWVGLDLAWRDFTERLLGRGPRHSLLPPGRCPAAGPEHPGLGTGCAARGSRRAQMPAAGSWGLGHLSGRSSCPGQLRAPWGQVLRPPAGLDRKTVSLSPKNPSGCLHSGFTKAQPRLPPPGISHLAHPRSWGGRSRPVPPTRPETAQSLWFPLCSQLSHTHQGAGRAHKRGGTDWSVPRTTQ